MYNKTSKFISKTSEIHIYNKICLNYPSKTVFYFSIRVGRYTLFIAYVKMCVYVHMNTLIKYTHSIHKHMYGYKNNFAYIQSVLYSTTSFGGSNKIYNPALWNIYLFINCKN